MATAASKPVLELAVPVPTAHAHLPSELYDESATFARLTADAPRDEVSEAAFLASRAHLIRTDPHFDRPGRASAYAELAHRAGHELVAKAEFGGTAPVPGGVGRGFFYTTAFKSGFAQGTSSYFEIVCPDRPAGNVDNYLYLTGMNRAGRGIEAFVSYHAQDEPRFKVFDWSRAESEHWQTDTPFSSLGSYLGQTSAHGRNYQTLGIWNSTYRISATDWRNEALLWNRAAGRWDLVYRHDYAGTQVEQTGGWVGSWGPIVETFQTSYYCTNPMGALNTMLISRDSNAAWGTWQLLSAADSTIRNDNLGFFDVFIDP
jgi:hypothetical protein